MDVDGGGQRFKTCGVESGGLTKEDVLSINWTTDYSLNSDGMPNIYNSATGERFPYETKLSGNSFMGYVDGEWVRLWKED